MVSELLAAMEGSEDEVPKTLKVGSESGSMRSSAGKLPFKSLAKAAPSKPHLERDNTSSYYEKNLRRNAAAISGSRVCYDGTAVGVEYSSVHPGKLVGYNNPYELWNDPDSVTWAEEVRRRDRQVIENQKRREKEASDAQMYGNKRKRKIKPSKYPFKKSKNGEVRGKIKMASSSSSSSEASPVPVKAEAKSPPVVMSTDYRKKVIYIDLTSCSDDDFVTPKQPAKFPSLPKPAARGAPEKYKRASRPKSTAKRKRRRSKQGNFSSSASDDGEELGADSPVSSSLSSNSEDREFINDDHESDVRTPGSSLELEF